jgi:hypothetical protein
MGPKVLNGGSTSSTPVVPPEVSDGADVKDMEERDSRERAGEGVSTQGTWMASTSTRIASIEIDDVDTVEEGDDASGGGRGGHGRGGGYGSDGCEGVVSFDDNGGGDDDGHEGNGEDGGYDGYEWYGSGVTHGESQGGHEQHDHNEHGKHDEEQGWNGGYGEHGEHGEHGEYEYGQGEFADSDGGYNGQGGQAEHGDDGVDVLAVARAQLRKVFGRLDESGAEGEDGGWGQHQYVAR